MNFLRPLYCTRCTFFIFPIKRSQNCPSELQPTFENAKRYNSQNPNNSPSRVRKPKIWRRPTATARRSFAFYDRIVSAVRFLFSVLGNVGHYARIRALFTARRETPRGHNARRTGHCVSEIFTVFHCYRTFIIFFFHFANSFLLCSVWEPEAKVAVHCFGRC